MPPEDVKLREREPERTAPSCEPARARDAPRILLRTARCSELDGHPT